MGNLANDPSPVSDFPRPYPVQFKGSLLARWVLRLFGWRVRFEGFPALQGVLAIYPHTSNWDFVVMVLAKWSVGVQARFWAKDKLFKVPVFGPWLRWLGAIPVNRTSSSGVVGHAVSVFQQHKRDGDYFWIALAPEGTRKYLPGWRSGFFRTAQQAGVPLGLVRLDYGQRLVSVVDFIHLTGDEAADMARVAAICAGAQGAKPANAAPVRLLDPSIPRADTIVK